MIQKKILPLFLILFPVISRAHGSHGSGFMSGFTHPIFGWDHCFAILGTGILGYAMQNKSVLAKSTLENGKTKIQSVLSENQNKSFIESINQKAWIFPLTFLIAMILGGSLGIGNEASITIEKIIALSSIGIGIFIFLENEKLLPLIIVSLLVFGFNHGFAHGAEMPDTTTPIKYISGFSIGTILLSGIGSFIAYAFIRCSSSRYSALLGGVVLGAGIVFLLG